MDDCEIEHTYTIYRKTIEKIVMTEKDGVHCYADAMRVGKQLLGPKLIEPEDYPEDREIRVRLKVIRGKTDPNKE